MSRTPAAVPLLPGYKNNHPLPVRGGERRARPMELQYLKNTMFDFPIKAHETKFDPEETKELVATMKKPDWRIGDEAMAREFVPFTAEERQAMKREEALPTHPPAWLRHDKQVCRFFGYTQDSVVDSAEENARTRFVKIYYYLEDGTMSLVETKERNSGLPAGPLVNRHCIMKEEGGVFGLDDLKCGTNLTIYKRTYRVVGCDAFTRWYYEQNGIDVGESEESTIPVDAHTAKKIFLKEWEAKSAPKSVVEGQIYNEKSIGGDRGGNDKLEQFMRNDLRVLRFYCWWDDQTTYGTRSYYILSYFLAQDTVQIADVIQRNSGKSMVGLFFKKAKLPKVCTVNICPGMLEPEKEFYTPKDFRVGGTIDVYGRKLFVYDCDPYTRQFYSKWLDVEQGKVEIPPLKDYTMPMPIPPHVGVGTEEDTLGSCFALWPKPPKQDLMKLMTKSGMILRMEAEIAKPTYPEDMERKFIIAYSLQDDCIAVYEMKRRNSGFMEGKFSEKGKKRNPLTGKFYTLDDLWVGNTMTVASVEFRLLRPDEYSLNYMEATPQDFPYSDLNRILPKLAAFLQSADKPVTGPEAVYTPQDLQNLGCLVDQEIITLLRKFATEEEVVVKGDDMFA